jgi:hypothetical protein
MLARLKVQILEYFENDRPIKETMREIQKFLDGITSTTISLFSIALKHPESPF